jgi:predicted ATP-dependent endonuclease of OLD family
MLDRQPIAQQVIYTTHSAGCLPPDIGTGVRPIIPSESGGTSTLSNSFWTEGPGFTPMLLAMGASAAAFAPTRYAVLTEGASDMLLLPTLLREATGRDLMVTLGVRATSIV